MYSTDRGTSLFDLSANKKNLENQMGGLYPGTSKYFVSRAHWNLHELVQHFALQLDKPDLYFTTWAMKEQPARALLDMCRRGTLGNVYCLISDRMPGNDREALQLLYPVLKGQKELKLHAKVAVLMDDTKGIVILGSANWSANPRIECGVVTHDYGVASCFKNWITDEIGKGTTRGN